MNRALLIFLALAGCGIHPSAGDVARRAVALKGDWPALAAELERARWQEHPLGPTARYERCLKDVAGGPLTGVEVVQACVTPDGTVEVMTMNTHSVSGWRRVEVAR